MQNYVLTGGTVYRNREFFPNESIGLVGGRQSFCVGDDGISRYRGRISVDEITLDDGDKIAPGFINEHTHGSAGYDTMEGGRETIVGMGLFNAHHGVTTFLPTLVGATDEQVCDVLSAVGKLAGKSTGGARVVGSYLEGTFIEPGMAGAQNPAYMHGCDTGYLQRLIDASNGTLRVVALAPELEGAMDFIDYAVGNGIVVALGHSNATGAQAYEAINHGATRSVHTYNRQSPLNHRNIGLVGVTMRDPRIIAELIADGHHVCEDGVHILMDMKKLHTNDAGGMPNVSLITDSVQPTGYTGPPRQFYLAEKPIYAFDLGNGVWGVYNDPARKGNIAGSCLTTDVAVRNMVRWGYPIEQVLAMVSEMPACNLGIFEETGSISNRKLADVVVLDRDLEVRHVFVRGRKVK